VINDSYYNSIFNDQYTSITNYIQGDNVNALTFIVFHPVKDKDKMSLSYVKNYFVNR